ncbi:MAG: STAS domain-containing protein [Chitinivibrionales bacterium]|nr:STAS domain-containing protein [Chitinivibrionales bacterium]
MAILPLSLKIDKKDTYTLCTVRGDLMGPGLAQFNRAIGEVLSAPTKHLVLALDDVHNFDSTGLDTILTLKKKTASIGCGLSLIISKQEIKEVFDITGCLMLFPLFESLQGFEQDAGKKTA